MFVDQPSGAGYESFEGDNDILVRDAGGRATSFGKVSPISQVLNRQLMFRRLHIAPHWRDAAAEIVGSMK
jgi:hypothetical protein